MTIPKDTGRETRRGDTLDDHTIGVAWIAKSQWVVLQSVCVDGWLVQKSYGQWRKESRDVMAAIQKTGIRAQKVTVDVDLFVVWCRQHSRPVNSAALAGYVNDCLADSKP